MQKDFPLPSIGAPFLLKLQLMRLYIIHSSNKEIVIKNYIRIDRLYLFDCLTHLPNNKFLLSHEQIDSNPLEDKNIPTSSISTQRVHIFPIPKSSGKISEISHEFRGFDFGFRQDQGQSGPWQKNGPSVHARIGCSPNIFITVIRSGLVDERTLAPIPTSNRNRIRASGAINPHEWILSQIYHSHAFASARR